MTEKNTRIFLPFFGLFLLAIGNLNVSEIVFTIWIIFVIITTKKRVNIEVEQKKNDL